MDVTDKIVRGEQAKRILEDETFKAALTEIRQKVFRDWSATGHADYDAREHLWAMSRIVDEVEGMLVNYLNTGLLEAETVKQKTLFDKMKDLVNG